MNPTCLCFPVACGEGAWVTATSGEAVCLAPMALCLLVGREEGQKDREDAQGPVPLLGVRTGLGLGKDWVGPSAQDETDSSWYLGI